MADLFGDPSLFDEFDKEQLPCDKILRQKFKKDVAVLQNTSVDEGSDSAFSAEFHVGSDSDSESENENDFIENEDSDHGGGITGVGDILHKLNNELVDSKPIGKDLSQGKSSNGTLDSERYLRMKQQLDTLMGENMKLKNQVRLVSCDKVSSQDGPAVQVVFTNHDIARKYKSEIEDFIQHLLENDKHEKLSKLYLRQHVPTLECSSNLLYQHFHHMLQAKLCVFETTVPAESRILHSARRFQGDRYSEDVQASHQRHLAINSSHFYTDYIVDSMGWPLIGGDPALTDGWYVPAYERVYSESLPTDESQEDYSKPQPTRKRGGCFNCGGEHNIRECKEVLDQNRIMQARREMAENNGPKKQRYILEEGSCNQSKFRPGEISPALRDALGINSRQLPPHIYQMRRLGYPPGWLAEAEVLTSGMAMFDKHGKEVTTEGESMEDGEVDVNDTPKKAYDKEKLVSYPGFNVDPPKDALDEHEDLGMPSMQPHHQREALELFLTPQKDDMSSGKKRKLGRDEQPGGSTNSKKGKYTGCGEDMDIDSQDSSFSEPTSRGSQSPSMDSLRQQHLLIQAQLADMEGGSDTEVQVLDSCEDGEISDSFMPPVPPTPEAPPLPPGTPPTTPQIPAGHKLNTSGFRSPLVLPSPVNTTTPSRIPLPQNQLPMTTASPQASSKNTSPVLDSPLSPGDGVNSGLSHRTPVSASGGGGSVSSTSGTPVILAKAPVSASADSKGLPEARKFAAGIMEHLPFENLPDSTGKYQQMKKVLEGIRSNRKKS